MSIEPRKDPRPGRRRRGGAEVHRIVALVENARKPLVAISDFGRIVAINAIAAAVLGLGGTAIAREPDNEGAPASMIKRDAESPRKARERVSHLLAAFPEAQQTRVRVKTSQFSGWLVILGRGDRAPVPAPGASPPVA